jgi:ribonuclease HI
MHSILSITANAAAVGRKPGSLPIATWTKPEPRQIKLNVDASFHSDVHAGAAAAVLRDYQGNFLAAGCWCLPHVLSSAMAESLALKKGLSLAHSLGYNDLIAESDSVEVIESCTGEQTWWNECSAIFADIVDITSSFDKVTFKYCPREANKVAHELAKFSFLNNESCNWVDEPPSFLLNNIINDVTIL